MPVVSESEIEEIIIGWNELQTQTPESNIRVGAENSNDQLPEKRKCVRDLVFFPFRSNT